MPKITVAVPHNLSPTKALEKAQAGLEKTVKDFQGQDLITTPGEDGTSSVFQFKSMAFTIKGNVKSTENDLQVELDLPFAAMMFKDKAQKAIEKNLSRVLGGE